MAKFRHKKQASMKNSKLPGARFFPEPWTWSEITVKDEQNNDVVKFLVTNSHFKYHASTQEFAEYFVNTHNERERWFEA